MKKFLIIFCFFLLLPALTLAADNNNLQLRQLQVTPYPRTSSSPAASPPTNPGPSGGRPSPPSTNPSPPSTNPSPPTVNPNPDRQPNPGPPDNFCGNYFVVVYGTNRKEGYALAYVKPEYLAANRDKIRPLVQTSNFGGLGEAVKAGLNTIDQIIKQNAGVVSISLSQDAQTQLASLRTKVDTLLVGASDPVDYYIAMYTVIDDPAHKDLVATVVDNIVRSLKQRNLPNLPFLAINPNHRLINSNYSADLTTLWQQLFGGYIISPDPLQAISNWGCATTTPITSIATSPYLYLYPTLETAVNIKVGRAVTYSDPDYSLINGFNIVAKPEGTRLYYEFLSDTAQVTSDKLVVVKGDKIKNYLFNNLLPGLGLTDQELTDYQEDIRKQLSVYSLQFTENYQIILLQNQEVDNLIPLTITPKPDTLIRNMIIIKPTNLAPTYPFTLTPLPFRSGFTVVENGFMVE